MRPMKGHDDPVTVKVSLTGSRPARDEVVHTIPPPRSLSVLALMDTLPAVLGLGAAISSLRSGEVVIGLVAAAVAMTFGAVSAVTWRMALLPAAITATSVASPRAVRGWTIVPLTQITGVGLRYRSTGNARSSGWVLRVWTESGESIPIKVAGPKHTAPPNQRKAFHRLTGYVPPLDWGYLAASPPGQVAAQIQDSVLAVQGQTGPLARHHREKLRDSSHVDTAYWSPTGEVGPLNSPPPTGQPGVATR